MNRKRLLTALCLFAGLLVAGRLSMQTRAFERWFTGLVQVGMEEALGEEVLLGRATLELWPARATLTGVVITSAEDGHTIATLEQGRAWLGVGRGGPRLRLLELDEPELRLHVDEDGLREFPALRGEGGGGELPYDELIVRGGDLTVFVQERFELSATGIELRPGLELERVDLSVARLLLRVDEVEQVAEGVRAERMTFRRDRLIVPDLRLDFPVAQLRGHGGVVFGGELGGDLSVVLHDAALSEVLPEGVSLVGPLSVDVELMGTVDAPSVGLALAAQTVLWVDEADYDLGDLSGVGRVDQAGLTLDRVSGVWAGGFLDFSGQLDWAGELSDADLVLEDVSLSQALVDLGPWTEPWVDFRGDLEYQPTGTLSPLSLSGPVELAVIDLEVAGGPPSTHAAIQRVDVGRLSGRLDFRSEGVLILAETIALDASVGELRAELPWDGDAAIDLDFEELDLRTFKPLGGAGLRGRGRLQARITGPYSDLRLTGAAHLSNFGLLGFRVADTLTTPLLSEDWVHVDLPGFQATLGSTRLHGDMLLDFSDGVALDTTTLVNGRLDEVAGVFVPTEGWSSGVVGTVELRGPVERLDGEVLLDLSGVDLFGERFGEGRIEGRMDGGTFSLQQARVERGDEALVAHGTVGAGWAMAVDVRGEGLKLETLDALTGLDPTLGGQLGLQGRVGGTLLEMEPSGSFTLTQGRLRGEGLPELRVEFGTEGRRLTGALSSDDGTLQGLGSIEMRSGAAWELDARFRRFPAHLAWPLAADGRPVTALVDGELSGLGVLGESFAVTGAGHRASLWWAGRALNSAAPFTGAWDAEGWALTGLDLVGEATRLQVSALGSGGELSVSAAGTVDASWLPALTTTIEQAAGPMGLDLVLEGPVEALGGRVDLDLMGVDLRSPAFPHPLEELRGKVQGRPDAYRLPEPLTGELGGGQVEILGHIDALNWEPTRYALEATVVGARVDLVEELPPMVADAELRLGGPADDLLLSGQVTIQDMLFAERIEWEQWTVDWRERHLDDLVDTELPREPLFALDIAVVSEGTARVRNNVGEGLLEADLRVVGDDTRVGMVGEVRMLDGGRAFLHDREFDVTRGELRYVDPYTYDPLVDFILETDVRNGDRNVHITYPVNGPFSDLQTSPRSDPPLSERDINALLLFGVTGTELEQGGGAGAALVLEGAGLLLSSETSRALERLGPEARDVFQYTQVDLVTGVSQRGALTSTEWRLLVEQDLDEPLELTVVGEFSLDDTYLAAEREVYDNLYVNLYWSSEQRERSLDIGGAYGAEFKVRWESD